MSSISLPVCRWRSPAPWAGRQLCSSPLVSAGPWGVPTHICRMCAECDHIDPAATAAAVPAQGWVRHLIYHLYPAGDWHYHCHALLARLSLFNGSRLISVATDPDHDQVVGEVAAFFRDLDVEIVQVRNDSGLKEMMSYPRLLARLERWQLPNDVHFYGHSKGVITSQNFDGARRWADAMYGTLLDHWPAVERELRQHCAVGIFRRHWQGPIRTRARWHYSGTFRWVRNRDLFSRNWREIDQTWLGSETHPGLLFGAGEASCLFGEFSTQDCGLYQSHEWDRWAGPQQQEWTAAHLGDRQAPVLATVILTAHAQRELVHEAIQSVLAQTSDSWQLLIVSSGRLEQLEPGIWDRYSTDARVSVLNTGEAREGVPRGQGWAINQAWRCGRVRGDLVLHLCDDDLLNPEALGRFVAASRLYPEQAAWYGRLDRVQLGSRHGVARTGRLETFGVVNNANAALHRADGGQVCHRRAARTEWPEEPADGWHADGLWIDRLAQSHPIHPLDFTVGVHRFTPDSTFTKKS